MKAVVETSIIAQEIRGRLISLDGEMLEVSGLIGITSDNSSWRCLFAGVSGAQRIKIGEPFQLMLDDGRAGHVIIYRINDLEGHVEAIGQGPLW